MTDEVRDEPTVADLKRALLAVNHAVLREARMRGWCSEYEDVVRRINEELGFEALGMRMRRRTHRITYEFRFRGDEAGIGAGFDEFVEYVAKFRPKSCELLEAPLYISGETLANVEVDTLGEESLPPETVARPPGWRQGACNCESCMRERADRMF